MANGKIKFFKEDRGFGFIVGEDGKDYFLHISKVKGVNTPPKEDDPVTFSSRPGKKGEEAYDVVLLKMSATTTSTSTPPRTPYSASGKPYAKPQKSRTSTQASGTQNDSRAPFPYKFTRRPAEFAKKRPDQLHDRLNQDCYDIAFDVEWRALTPVAANPCSDPSAGPSYPPNNNGEYQGYDKRWLMVDGRLAISPFTVKSAVANGFASLLGSCYRVENEEVAHRAEAETFQCTGVYKRYRVPMDNSKPGILQSIDHATGEISIIPVTEFFYDEPEPPKGVKFIHDQTYDICYETRNHKNIITGLGQNSNGKLAKAIYYGPYRFGMNLTFGPGDFNKHHYHRFYLIENAQPLKGEVNLINLAPLAEQKKKVFMGVFKKLDQTERYDRRTGYDGDPWHQDLGPDNPEFQVGKWVYYQTHKDKGGKERITAIGLNFQFKTAFHLIDDAVPEGQRECGDLNHLCPRCAMFGITVDDSKEAVGLRGRFKAATLTGPKVEAEERFSQKANGVAIELTRWRDSNGTEIASQFLLPIQGQAKASKRNGGYYNDLGLIQGAKQYLHAELDYVGLTDSIERVNNCKNLGDYYGQALDARQSSLRGIDYSHPQRNYAMVCRDRLTFSGTLGAENCTVEEIAALLMVLDHSIAQHGFKIGLDKAIGLGSMTSTINKVWLRKSADAPWMQLTLPISGSSLAKLQAKGNKGKIVKLTDLQQQEGKAASWPTVLDGEIKGLAKAAEELKKVQHVLNQTDNSPEGPLVYPPPGSNYWKSFRQLISG